MVNPQLVRMSQETGIELVATNDVHYTYAEDAEAHDILLCIQTGKKLSDENRMRYEGGQYYVKSEEEMRKLFSFASQAIDNTQKIADRCHVEIEFGVTKLPHFEVRGWLPLTSRSFVKSWPMTNWSLTASEIGKRRYSSSFPIPRRPTTF